MKWWAGLLFMFVLLAAGNADADIDESAYEAGGALSDPREQAKMRERIAAEIEAEHERAALQAEAVQRAREAAAARAAARPYPERLTEQRCTLCHVAGNFEAQRHTWLGWRLVVSRMVWFNGAPIGKDEQSVIVDHLAATHPADVEARIIEHGLPAAFAAALAAAIHAGRRLLARRRLQRKGVMQ